MALSKSTMSTTIKSSLDTYLGSAQDSAQRVKMADALADAIYTILTNQASVSGTCTGATAPVVNGSPAAIVSQPVTATIS
jgi:hypothetical protein